MKCAVLIGLFLSFVVACCNTADKTKNETGIKSEDDPTVDNLVKKMEGAKEISLELRYNNQGSLVFERSRLLDDCIRITVYDEGGIIWSVNMGGRDFKSIIYGELPKTTNADHRRNPEQEFPSGISTPRKLKPGDSVVLALEFPKDSFPMAPGSSAEYYKFIIPKKGQKLKGTWITQKELRAFLK